MIKKVLFIIIVLFLSWQTFGQASLLDSIQKKHDVGAYKDGRKILLEVDTTDFTELQKSKYLYVHAISHINIEGEMQETYNTLLNAKKLVGERDLSLLFNINDELIYSQYSLVQVESTANELMDENCAIAQIIKKPDALIGCNSYKYMRIDDDDPLEYEKKLALLHDSRSLAFNANLDRVEGNMLINIATTHELGQRFDSALYYYNKSKQFVEKKNYAPTTIVYYSNLGYTYIQLKRYDEAIEVLNKALELSEAQDLQPNKSKILMNLATAYERSNDYQKSSETYQKVIAYSNEKNETVRFNNLQELETKYQVQERKLENAELAAENERQTTMTIAVAGSALTLFLIGGFVYNNQRKKKRLAEQEAELEKQRADNLLKNQELATIDAMITGQEKERRKIAGELHDDLGSSMTTMRLYFDQISNSLKTSEDQDIYNRTKALLDDTYQTVRSMSHRMHYGVMASKGLVPSVQSLAQRISDSKAIQIEVITHKMDRNLENSLELNIFRIVQELLSNIVKHAGAKHATVNLIGGDDSIHIMVEDDGHGFDTTLKRKKEGMGLYSIETRLEDIDGTVEVDSTINHGTTVTIEIPLI
ncbi:tetratricopeptide repeat-containing sensor histidine kinase [Nonlabens ponticola]|uniref:histidine kinase n=1 Tax=Nonlabens ponticola TaxID=2496866 RepID=A0A3S9MZC3_9FLAO|nr:sensor histidine kinase [Nonlabens ponticola]AZQ44605.1 tetratricopeptide repeat protein [Nonlabens ponticola]